jgi:uncharacterized membrane protein
VFGDRFIWFGVLHAIAVMSLVVRPVLGLRGWLIAAGVAVIAIGAFVRLPLFDHPSLQWIGLMTHKPPTEDYVPLIPWIGPMLIGAGSMCLVAAAPPALRAGLSGWRLPRRLRWIGWMGRHSLAIYLIHQPLLFGALHLIRLGVAR